MKKFQAVAKIEFDLSSELIGEDSSEIMSKMYEIIARINREIGAEMLVQLGDQTVHKVRFDNVESEVEHVEELEDFDEEIEKSHAATNSMTKLAM